MDDELKNDLAEIKRLLGHSQGYPSYAKIEDLYSRLGTVIGLLERLNETVYNLGVAVSDNEEWWHHQNRNT